MKKNMAGGEVCEDGIEYGIDPEDYETEDDYMDALNKEKNEWRFTCEDGSEYGVDPEDYDTEEEYMDALEDAIFLDTGDLYF